MLNALIHYLLCIEYGLTEGSLDYIEATAEHACAAFTHSYNGFLISISFETFPSMFKYFSLCHLLCLVSTNNLYGNGEP